MTSKLEPESLLALSESCKDLNAGLLSGKGLIIVRLRRFQLEGADAEVG